MWLRIFICWFGIVSCGAARFRLARSPLQAVRTPNTLMVEYTVRVGFAFSLCLSAVRCALPFGVGVIAARFPSSVESLLACQARLLPIPFIPGVFWFSPWTRKLCGKLNIFFFEFGYVLGNGTTPVGYKVVLMKVTGNACFLLSLSISVHKWVDCSRVEASHDSRLLYLGYVSRS